MKERNFTAYQGDTKTLMLTVRNNGEPINLDGKTIRAQMKRVKDKEILAEFQSEAGGNKLLLTLDGAATESIDIIGDYELFYYDVYADNQLIIYGTVKMIKGVSCHGN